MRVFVTGATGYIGTAVVDTLLARGHSVLGLSRSEASAAALTGKGAQAHHGSLDDLPTLTQGAASCDGVIHLAFTGGFADFERACRADKSAIETIGHALAESGSGKALVIASGTLILASESTEPATEDQALDMSSPLAIRAQSEVAALECAKRGVRTSVVRLPPTNHGAGDVRGFIAQMVAKARQEGVSAFIGEGGNVWPATARLDSAKVFVLALEKGAAGDVFHAVAEERVPIKAIATSIGKQLNVPVVSKTQEEAGEMFGFLAFPLGLNNPTSSAKTREQLGWVAEEPTLLEDIENGVYTKA